MTKNVLRHYVIPTLLLIMPVTSRGQSSASNTPPSTSSQIEQLQRSLAAANARIASLQAQNAALLRQLGRSVPSAARADNDDAETTVVNPPTASAAIPSSVDNAIKLPDVKWNSPDAQAKLQLTSGINVTAIRLTPFGDGLTATQIDPMHLAVSVHKISGGLGDDRLIEAGKLWCEGGALFLQWDRGDQSVAADLLRFSVCKFTGGTNDSLCTFFVPQALPLMLDNDARAHLDLSATVVASARLVATQPTDWQMTVAKDGSINLAQLNAKIQIQYAAGGLHLACSGDSGAVQRRIDANAAEIKKIKQDIISVSHTNVVDLSISERENRIESLTSQNESLRTAMSKCVDIGELDGTTIGVTLPNGVKLAQITLRRAHPAPNRYDTTND